MDRELLERVLNISRHLAETRALGPLLNYAMDEAIDLVGAERGYLVLVGKEGNLDFRVHRGQEHSELQASQDQVSKSILTKVIETGQPLTVRDASSDPDFERAKSVSQLKIRSVMCVPLIARGETIGAIYVENRAVKGRFSEDSIPPLIFFANQAAVLIENAALNDELEARVADRTRDLERAMQQLEQSWTETVEANRLRTVLLGNVAHDLRAPLSIVVGSLTLLLDGTFGDLQPEQSEWINKALDASNYVLKLSNDVFDLMKLEMGHLTLTLQEVDLKTLLDEIFEIGKGLPWPAGVELKLDVRTPIPTMTVDPIRIQQVLLNLLSNALKFTKSGAVTIHAEHVVDKNAVLLGVADTGEGIPPELIKLLFQRFQQVDTDAQRRSLGAGLGLAICRDLIEMHGGQIWAESSVGVGSDFKFTLPITREESA